MCLDTENGGGGGRGKEEKGGRGRERKGEGGRVSLKDRAEDLARQLRALGALAENPHLVPSTYMAAHNCL